MLILDFGVFSLVLVNLSSSNALNGWHFSFNDFEGFSLMFCSAMVSCFVCDLLIRAVLCNCF